MKNQGDNMRKRLAAAAVLGIVVFTLAAAPALAHVVVNPSEANKGEFARLAFRVPNEMDNADTVKIDVQFSSEHPIANVSVQPKAGWTVDVKKDQLRSPLQTGEGQVTEAVSEITWSGGKIGPGQFDEFVVSAGPLPSDADVLVFPTIQTYSDGTEVKWIQQTFAGQPEPDSPAPQLALTSAKASAKKTSSSSSNTTKYIAIAGLVVAVAALGVGGLAFVNVRRWR
jgi:uncharacterized protein YcnI